MHIVIKPLHKQACRSAMNRPGANEHIQGLNYVNCQDLNINKQPTVMTAKSNYRAMASHACGSVFWKQAYHLEAHSILEEDIVVLADSKVMGVEEGLVHGELLACHLLPVLIKLVDVNGHFRPCQRLDLAACKDFC